MQDNDTKPNNPVSHPGGKIKQQILEQVREYYRLAHDPVGQEFVAGKSRINYGGRVFDESELVNLVDASLEFWLTYGRYSKEFENRFKEFLGNRFCLLVNSGSSANLLAFMALTSPLLKERRIERGNEVITVAAGFPTTVAPIIQYGAIPVFVDVDLTTANIACARLDAALSSHTKAVLLAHTLGNPFDLKTVTDFCRKHNLWLIEDNCDALGSRHNGKFTGTYGDIGTSSFYPPHHMTMGEGGAVYTNNPLLHKIMLSMRDWGRDCWCESGHDNTCGCRFCGQHGTLPFGYDHKYVYSHFGYNLKATDLQAAVGCAQLDKLPGFIKARQHNFNILFNELKQFEEYFILPQTLPDNEPSWFGFLITLRDNAGFTRNQLVEHLEKHRIQTRNLFAGNLTKHPCFAILKDGVDFRISGELSNTDKIMRDSFWLGLFPGMNSEKLNYIVEQIKLFIDQQES